MKRTAGIALLVASLLIVLPFSLSPGQDGGKDEETRAQGSGIQAVVTQIGGEKTVVEEILFRKEELGILSLTKVPASTYILMRGKARISVMVTEIQRIEFDNEVVRIMGIDGQTLEGSMDQNTHYFLAGNVAFGGFEVDLADVRSIEFKHPKATQNLCPACNRLYINPSWKYCPHDGAKLKSVK